MASEPFPLLNTSADQLHNADANAPRRRRTSSALSGGIRAGDTGAPALATSRASINANDPSRLQAIHQADARASSPSSAGKRGSKRRRTTRGLMSRVRQTMIKHTYVLPACLLILFLTGYAVNPTESNPLHRFIFLSYRLPNPAAGNGDPSQPAYHYGKGPWDIALVSFYTIVLSFTREFIMQEMLRPLARRWGLAKSKQARFMEQMYTAIYFGVLGPAGMYVMSRTPVWYFNTRGMYEAFPHRTHEGVVKFYYLFEAAYWAQQAIVLVLGLEKRRKDFKELIGHHIVSLSLIGLSYRFHFTYMGIAVYITHDISDFFLATSKTLNYVDHPLMGPYFAFFAAIWIYLRHYINLKIIWSLFTEFRTVGPFELNWETQQYKCWISQYITTALLASLQALNLFWLFFILRIAYRFVVHDALEDDRSEDEGGDEEIDEEDEDRDQVRETKKQLAAVNEKPPKSQKPNGKRENKSANGSATASNGSAKK